MYKMYTMLFYLYDVIYIYLYFFAIFYLSMLKCTYD